MTTARAILTGTVVLAGPIAVFCLIAALPFAYVSWLGGGMAGMVLAMAAPGAICIATSNYPVWQRAIGALLYLIVYAPACLIPGFFAACLLTGCSV